ncbi:bacteriochlorophyll 4-vinyl reductase [uncultured Rhodoblastus sp.]|uniref:bacteriochlorophyll 4-vinyl reductase n=1 Tax=uncultured Rhodoblastus sp. TaxID=543037 RepID=UPI0025D6ED8D|nr:bacteriochlorophyll 4-vinyl reductase [uncultured Rhodoblastus sp.]
MSNRRASISAPEFSRSRDAPASPDRIGPNAVVQLIVALKALGETEAMSRLFSESGRDAWLDAPPHEMIAASDAARLHVGLRRLLPAPRAEAALSEAGRLTADYLLANRIPPAAQTVLKLLPARLSAWVLMRAISAHAWTFAGSGVFSFSASPFSTGSGAQASIRDNPLCSGLRAEAPACVWHAAVFERLFRALVSPSSRVEEIDCCARGDACCRFRLDWAGAKGVAPTPRTWG